MTLPPSIGIWMRAMRLPFLSATLVPVVLGTMLAWRNLGAIDIPIALLALFGVAFMHIGTNLANDYYDHLSGNDAKNKTPTPFSGGSRVIQKGLLDAIMVRNASFIFFALGLASLITIEVLNPSLWVIGIAIIGAFFGLFYTAPPFRLGYRGFGELITGMCFGPLAVLGSYVVQSGHFSLDVLLASLPVGILVGLILLINEFPDAEADSAVNKKTMVVLFGVERAMWIYYSMLALAYISIVCAVILGALPLFSLLAFATLPLLFKIVTSTHSYVLDKNRTVALLLPANGITILLHGVIGLILALSIGLDIFF